MQPKYNFIAGRVVTPSATARLHTTDTNTVPSTTLVIPSATARLHTTATHTVPSTTVVTPSAIGSLHTTATHAVPSTTETPELHYAAVTNTITPEDGRIRPKHVELYNTCNKVIHWLHRVGYPFALHVSVFVCILPYIILKFEAELF
jgi:hypothetical protein